MRDQYVGDIGDFGKYRLLRYICGNVRLPNYRPLRLGIVWYHTPNDNTNHGNAIHYLQGDHFLCNLSEFDEVLYYKLKKLVDERRAVSAVEKSDILPVASENFFSVRVGNFAGRDRWCNQAAEATAGVDLLFLDPNTGVPPRTDIKGDELEPNYARIRDLEIFANWKGVDKSLIIYQQSARGTNYYTDIERIQRIRECLNRPVWTLHWGPRHFLIIPSNYHREYLWNSLNSLREAW